MFVLNSLVTIASLTICCLLSQWHLPGMELLGVTPNWLLIWLVAWSVKRSVWQAATTGVAIGWLYDSLTVSSVSHVLSLVTVAVITASLNKEKYLEDSLISIALIIFIMAIVAETIFAVELALLSSQGISAIWANYLRIAGTSAVITSLWSPAVYAPLNRWWQEN